MPAGTPMRRVAITGMGIVSTCGIGLEPFFEGLCGPQPERERRVLDFDPSLYLDPKEERQTDRFVQFAVASAQMALDDTGAIDVDPTRAGVIYATGVGGITTLQEQIGVLIAKGARRVSPRLVPMMMSNAAPAAISMRFGWQGPCEAVVTACASATNAIGYALRLIQMGRCDAVITGGSEAAMTGVGDEPPVGVAAFANMTALSSTGFSRPFDVRRDGFVIAEGAGAIVLEEYEHAKARGAHIYAELLGAASNADAFHITAPSPNGAGALNCMELALEDAGITPAEVGHVNAHGTSTPANDLAEAQAIEKLFGLPGPPVTSIKGITGHALGAAGAIETIASVLTIEKGIIPPTAGLEELDPEIHLDVVYGAPRPFTPGPIVTSNFGFGGHNGTLVLGPASA
jgi:3-oxoacyl-[acyl-carrier-protein] synthase II